MVDQKQSRTATRPSAPSLPVGAHERANANQRWTKVLLWALAGALLIIATAIIFIPVADDEPLIPPGTASSDAIVSPGAANGDPGRIREVLQQVERAQQLLRLPQEPAPVKTEQLQQELEQLAEYLVQRFPEVAAAHHFAAQIWEGMHRTEKAEQHWRRAIELGTDAAGPYAGLADVLIQTGREEKALQVLETAEEQGIVSADMLLAKARALENLGQLEAARTVLESADASIPKDAQWWEVHARIANQLGDYPAAENSIRQALKQGDTTEARLFLLITCLTRQGKRDEAAKLSDQLRRLRATAQQQQGGFQIGYDAVLKQIARHAYLSAALLAEEHESWQLAEQYLRRALELEPDNAQILMELGTHYHRRGMLPEAIAVHQRLLNVQPENVFNYTNLASLWLQAGIPHEARRLLMAATEVDPQGVVAQAALARLALAEGRLADARRWAADVLERNKSVESHVLLATIEQAMGQEQAAAALIEKARQVDPQHPLLQQH